MRTSALNPTLDIIDTILGEAAFHKLLGALQAVQMVDFLKGAGPLTFFAPTDDAFAKVSADYMLELEKPANHEKLKQILEQHIVDGLHDARDLSTRSSLTTLNHSTLPVSMTGGALHVANAAVLGHDILCTNGVIHVLDSVFNPAA